jgi:hypothetical protein
MRCQRDGCNNEVPIGRRKYCGSECAAIVNKIHAAQRSKLYFNRHRPPKTIPRFCLRCRCPFESDGPWNRLCPDCNEENATVAPKNLAHKVMLGDSDD